MLSINEIRRRVMNRITKNIGRSNKTKSIGVKDKMEVKRVLICRPNQRLGNLLLTTPLIQEIIDTFPECEIDIIVKGGLAPTLYKNYENVKKVIELPKKPFKHLIKYILVFTSVKRGKYDLAINPVEGSSSGKILTLISSAKHKIFGDLTESTQLRFKDHMHMAKSAVYNLREYMSGLGFTEDGRQMPTLNLKLEAAEMAEGLKTLQEIVKNDKKTISIFTYATGSKCYSESWWEAFYEKLKNEYQDYNIVEVLPMENVSQISFKAPSFYSKDLRLIGALIANTELFIGADSGMMHLASAAQIPTVGLFAMTDENVYQPYGHHSSYINTNTMNNDEGMKLLNGILAKRASSRTSIEMG